MRRSHLHTLCEQPELASMIEHKRAIRFLKGHQTRWGASYRPTAPLATIRQKQASLLDVDVQIGLPLLMEFEPGHRHDDIPL